MEKECSGYKRRPTSNMEATLPSPSWTRSSNWMNKSVDEGERRGLPQKLCAEETVVAKHTFNFVIYFLSVLSLSASPTIHPEMGGHR